MTYAKLQVSSTPRAATRRHGHAASKALAVLGAQNSDISTGRSLGRGAEGKLPHLWVVRAGVG